MRDSDVRAAVLKMLDKRYSRDDRTRIVQEMGIWSGSVRIDVAVINGQLSGYELKSDRDTLQRLPQQIDLYGRVFDRLTLVVGARHAEKACELVPDWWGVIVASGDGSVSLRTEKRPALNPHPDPLMQARLLWRDEALDLLDRFGLAKGWRSKPVRLLHNRLASEVPSGKLARCVRETLKARTGWLGQDARD